MKKIPGWAKLVLKLLVSGGCLYYVAGKIDWAASWALLQRADAGWLLAAWLLFLLSKLVSALRLGLYFDNVQLHLSYGQNIRLYWLGMFYNLFLPGGIGGDAYKVLLLRQTHPQVSAKQSGAAVLLDRISGVAGLGILAAVAFFWLFRPGIWAWGALAAAAAGILIFYVLVRRWFPSFLSSFEATLGLGIAVQLLQVFCVVCIMQGLGIHHHLVAFQLLFLLSSIVAIFPFTIGGLGARELVFLWGARQFGLEQNEAVLISLVFYLLTVAGSLPGMYWVFRAPLQQQHSEA